MAKTRHSFRVNSEEDCIRCLYCDILWSPERETEECPIHRCNDDTCIKTKGDMVRLFASINETEEIINDDYLKDCEKPSILELYGRLG